MRALVTGGAGFLGRAIVDALLAEGHQVTTLSRGSYPELAALGVRHVSADLADAKAMRDAFAKQECVFHAAAKAGVWGARAEYERANVTATRNVIAACEQHRVPKLVFTSSPSVVFDGHDHLDGSEDLPYPRRYLAHYPRTKARAEQLVLEANGRWNLATCALRPHLIVGDGDPHLVPRVIARARAGRLAIVGDGTNLTSMTHVETAAAAHLDAARTLAPGAAHAGRAYFVNQREPVRLWDWIGEVLDAAGVARPTRRVPEGLAYAAGALLEGLWTALPLGGEPPMMRFVARQLAHSHTYDTTPAERDFGFRERFDMAEATRRVLRDVRASHARATSA